MRTVLRARVDQITLDAWNDLRRKWAVRYKNDSVEDFVKAAIAATEKSMGTVVVPGQSQKLYE